METTFRKTLAITTALLFVTVVSSVSASGPAIKIEPAELVARHLESIGSVEARSAIKNRVMIGTAVATFRRQGLSKIEGKAVLASEGEKVLIAMNFGKGDYPQENLGYDGRTLTAGYLSPGVRSLLGNFLLTHDVVFKHGLIGGVLSTSWPLLDLSRREARLEFAGEKKVNDQPAYEFEYAPLKGSDLSISMFFDAKTFRHVRTVYRRAVAAQMGANPDASARQHETNYKIVEDFSEFQKQANLMLPMVYRLELTVESPGGTISSEWVLTFNQFSVNQSLEAGWFNVSGK